MESAPNDQRGRALLETGQTMHEFVRRLYPIPRSLTGDGVRATLAAIAEHVPVQVTEVRSGTTVLDWEIPREWSVREAWLEDLSGRRLIDMADHGLHVLGYSAPIDRVVPIEELRSHLYSLPDRPDLIPYRTSYYTETWGLCASDRVVTGLTDEAYRVHIDSELFDGHLTYGEVVLPGKSDDTVVLTTHLCHPQLANDNLSGIAVLTALGVWLAARPRHLTYRLLFLPGTIGSITWLDRHDMDTRSIRAGLTVAGLGDAGAHTYKQTEAGNAWIDRAVGVAIRDVGEAATIREFSPWGYDERQFNSPGFRLPVGMLMRSPNGEYPEYHTSADDLDFVRPSSLSASLSLMQSVIEILEADGRWQNLAPRGEPQLGRRGLYGSVGGTHADPVAMARLWVLNQSDGTHGLLDIAERSGLPFSAVATATRELAAVGLLAPGDEAQART